MNQQRDESPSEFYVALNGDDSNPGTREAPFASIYRARDAIRELKRSGPLTQPINVVIRGGTYYLTETFVLTPEDSGTEDCAITYMAAAGERVKLSGGRPVTSEWRTTDGQIYFTDIAEIRDADVPWDEWKARPETYQAKPARWHFRQLFVNGRREIRARFPNQGWLFPAASTGHDRTIKCRPGTVRRNWAFEPDAQIHLTNDWNGFNQLVHLVDVDFDAHLLRFSGRETERVRVRNDFVNPIGGNVKRNWYLLEGLLEELDQPREWYLNPQTGRLYYWPEAGRNPDDLQIVAPYLNRIIYFLGDVEQGKLVEHVYLRGLHFGETTYTIGHIEPRVATDAAIKLNCASRCVIEDCVITNVGGNGIWLHLDSCRNVIQRNEISHAGAGGILGTSGRFAYDEDVSMYDERPAAHRVAPLRNEILYNHIHHVGLIRIYGLGIHFSARPSHTMLMEGNHIAHNLIHHVSRMGIFLHMNQGGNLVEYNELHHVCRNTEDCGAIYIATVTQQSSPNYVLNNYIHDVPGVLPDNLTTAGRKLIFGIYLDSFSTEVYAENNVLENNRFDATPQNAAVRKPAYICVNATSKDTGDQVLCANNYVDGQIAYFDGIGTWVAEKNYTRPNTPVDTEQIGLDGSALHDIPPEKRVFPGGVAWYYERDKVEIKGTWDLRKELMCDRTVPMKGRTLAYAGDASIAGHVRFRVGIPKAGRYEVYITYFSAPDKAASNVPITVTHANGEEILRFDETDVTWDCSGGLATPAIAHLIGTYDFDADQTPAVTIGTEGADGIVYVSGITLLAEGVQRGDVRYPRLIT